MVLQFSWFWFFKYNWFCEPVDYSDAKDATYVRVRFDMITPYVLQFLCLQMVYSCYFYFLCKSTEFIDTFCLVARKKFDQVR